LRQEDFCGPVGAGATGLLIVGCRLEGTGADEFCRGKKYARTALLGCIEMNDDRYLQRAGLGGHLPAEK